MCFRNPLVGEQACFALTFERIHRYSGAIPNELHLSESVSLCRAATRRWLECFAGISETLPRAVRQHPAECIASRLKLRQACCSGLHIVSMLSVSCSLGYRRLGRLGFMDCSRFLWIRHRALHSAPNLLPTLSIVVTAGNPTQSRKC